MLERFFQKLFGNMPPKDVQEWEEFYFTHVRESAPLCLRTFRRKSADYQRYHRGEHHADHTHYLFFHDARHLSGIDDQSIDLVVTSPPYPMIEMWDDVFTQLNPTMRQLLTEARGRGAFECMHQELDHVVA